MMDSYVCYKREPFVYSRTGVLAKQGSTGRLQKYPFPGLAHGFYA